MDYSAREGALEIDDENGYILQVKQDYMDIVEQLCPVELKPSVLKTLTIIALKEPIRQSYLKELRSNAYEHVQELLKMGLISRHRDKNGRSFNLKTTPKFAEYFKLKGDAKTLAKIMDLEKQAKEKGEDEDSIDLSEFVEENQVVIMVVVMSKTEKISELKTNKTRKVAFMFNDELWQLFKQTCETNKTKPTWEIEKWILNYLDKNNALD